MIVEFTVRPDQGDPSGFDLGDMRWVGELGEANSVGQTPDQGMMIYLSVVQVLDCLRPMLEGRVKNAAFVGVDTSFQLVFRSGKKGIGIFAPSGPVARIGAAELAGTVLLAAEKLLNEKIGELPSDDGAKSDYLLSLGKFRNVTLLR
ncbi:hypothetical protein ACWGIU_08240 [Streptomyces sp. NPDC054840]